MANSTTTRILKPVERKTPFTHVSSCLKKAGGAGRKNSHSSVVFDYNMLFPPAQVFPVLFKKPAGPMPGPGESRDKKGQESAGTPSCPSLPPAGAPFYIICSS
jgi:hypothetical protein